MHLKIIIKYAPQTQVQNIITEKDSKLKCNVFFSKIQVIRIKKSKYT
jgi:hypothetical protein